MPTKIQLRRDTTAGVTAAPEVVLGSGEPFVLNSNLLKIGDGSKTFVDLPSYAPNSHVSVLTTRQTCGLNQVATIFGGGMRLAANTVYEIEYQLIGRFTSNDTNLTLSVGNLVSLDTGRFLEAVAYATTSALGDTDNLSAGGGAITTVYSNGTSGVGATLTITMVDGQWANPLVIDGGTPTVGDRVLIKNQSSALQNGIYTLTSKTATAGGSTGNFVFTRATDNDQAAEILVDDSVYVNNGDANGDVRWVQTATVTTVGSSSITWSLYSASITSFGSYVNEWTCHPNINTSGYENLSYFGSISSDTNAPIIKDSRSDWQTGTVIQPAGKPSGKYFFTYKVKGIFVTKNGVSFNPRFSLSNTSHIKFFFLYSGSYIKATVLGPTSQIIRSGDWAE